MFRLRPRSPFPPVIVPHREPAQGWVQELSPAHVAGILLDPRHGLRRLRFEAVLPRTSEVLASGVADLWRPELEGVAGGDGRHGFLAAFARPLSEAERQAVVVRAAPAGLPLPRDPGLLAEWRPLRRLVVSVPGVAVPPAWRALTRAGGVVLAGAGGVAALAAGLAALPLAWRQGAVLVVAAESPEPGLAEVLAGSGVAAVVVHAPAGVGAELERRLRAAWPEGAPSLEVHEAAAGAPDGLAGGASDAPAKDAPMLVGEAVAEIDAGGVVQLRAIWRGGERPIDRAPLASIADPGAWVLARLFPPRVAAPDAAG